MCCKIFSRFLSIITIQHTLNVFHFGFFFLDSSRIHNLFFKRVHIKTHKKSKWEVQERNKKKSFAIAKMKKVNFKSFPYSLSTRFFFVWLSWAVVGRNLIRGKAEWVSQTQSQSVQVLTFLSCSFPSSQKLKASTTNMRMRSTLEKEE
jgi:hypothetical protein